MFKYKELALKSNAWPFKEAQKLLNKLQGNLPKKGYVLFETGYGPSGLPHIGTFGEVVRTSMVRYAFEQLSEMPTMLFCISDDMDGMRKVPETIPNPEKYQQYMDMPLTKIPDPFGTHESFGAHMNNRLCNFLDSFGFEYEFKSASECYAKGEFDEFLLRILDKYEDIMAIMLPTLREERQKTYSPFLPISPSTGKVLQVPLLDVNKSKGEITFADLDGTHITQKVTGGSCKLQWKPDFGMRWAAFDVDFEMYGKDHLANGPIYTQICKTIGGKAPLFLMLLRFLQGICVGGDGVGSSIFVLEHVADLKPGVIGGIVNAALTVGILLALCAGIVINHYFPGDTYAWRYSFMLGGVMGFVGLYLRLKIGETPVFQQLEKEDKVENLPIKKVFTENLNSCFVTLVAGAITGGMAYIVMVYLNVFLKSYGGFSASTALYITAYANICLIILLPLFGILSDRIGYARQMEYAAISTIALSVPLYMLLSSGNLFYILIASTMFAVLVAAVYSPLYPYIIVLFPPEQRYSGVACSLNIGIALLGGTCAVISIQLINITQIMWSPAFYISGVCFLFLITNRLLRQRNRLAIASNEII